MKQEILSTDLFKGKKMPSLFTNHPLFSKAIVVKKVFPGIGLPNFKEQANIDKCLVDIKKDGSYVMNMIKVLHDNIMNAQEMIGIQADKMQFLGFTVSAADKEANRRKLQDMYAILKPMTEVVGLLDTTNKELLNDIITSAEGKITLRLPKTVMNATDDKTFFKKGETLFGIYGKLREKCATFHVAMANLDTLEQYKTFSKENIPNRAFQIVFSSTGPEGAWDIATMSMRGIRSCQRWDGEYPKCLVGSVLSRFVGIMYLTSGVQSDDYADQNGGVWKDLGTKMMRRCVVRYAIDKGTSKPCILVEKMYPDVDNDILKVFLDTLQSKAKIPGDEKNPAEKIPVHYAPTLGARLKQMYLPNEEMFYELPMRDMPYQDTPIKSKSDFDLFILNNTKEEVERDVKAFTANLSTFLAGELEDIFFNNGAYSASPEIKTILSDIRMSTTFTAFSSTLATHIVNGFRAPQSINFTHSKAYYKKYIMDFIVNRKKTFESCRGNINTLLAQSVSRPYNLDTFVDFVCLLSVKFIKRQIKHLIS